MIVLAFAMRHESQSFVGRLRDVRTLSGRSDSSIIEGKLDHIAVKVVHTGVGQNLAEQRLRASGALSEAGKPRFVVSSGYAGALAPHLQIGSVVLVKNRSDPGLLESAATVIGMEQVYRGDLITGNAVIASATEKATLYASTGALAVDMETAAIARVCAEASVPLLALRVISDDARSSLPVPGSLFWDPKTERTPVARLMWHLSTHPARIGPLIRMVREVAPARDRLTHALSQIVSALGR